ncbi:hypothetical protein [Erythrobacter sp.]|uniref:hypothetical protein n=1 Tax=Erythrobacter sp. TaxID=1042 RepID=UPI001B1F4A8C|nr:hypothetical protein [Erythrobacter sp.]MBO6527847.1 hypothetical protein [Erythrobacter sp.]
MSLAALSACGGASDSNADETSPNTQAIESNGGANSLSDTDARRDEAWDRIMDDEVTPDEEARAAARNAEFSTRTNEENMEYFNSLPE